MTTTNEVLKGIKKNHGDRVATQGVQLEDERRLPTDVFAFDMATGGGFPRGRISILYGPESSLKTTAALRGIAKLQEQEAMKPEGEPRLKAVFVDVENAYDPSWGAQLGVNNDDMIFVQPDYAEQAVDMIEAFLHAEDVGLVVVDSLAALIPTQEIDSSAEKANVGGSGLVVGKLYRKATLALGAARKDGRDPALIAINQVRQKVGVMYGDPETMPGGNAFKFASALTIRMYGKDEEDKKISAAMPAWKKCSGVVKKWKVPILQRSFEFYMASVNNLDAGVRLGEVYDWTTIKKYLQNYGLLAKKDKGQGWVFWGTEYGTLNECKAAFYGDPELGNEIRYRLLELVFNDSGGEVSEDDDEPLV